MNCSILANYLTRSIIDVETITTTSFVASTSSVFKRELPQATDSPQLDPRDVIVGSGRKPNYATGCSNVQAYATACLCYGANPPAQSTSTQTKTVVRTIAGTVTSTTTIPFDKSGFTSTAASATGTQSGTIIIGVPAAQPTFDCGPLGYYIYTSNGVTRVVSIDLVTGNNSPLVGAIPSYQFINAFGYNPADNYLYALAMTTASQNVYDVIRVGSDGSLLVVSTVTLPPTSGIGYNMETFDTDGNFVVSARGQEFAVITLSPRSRDYGRVIRVGTSNTVVGNVADWVYLPGRDPAYLYSIGTPAGQSAPFQGTIQRWSFFSGQWSTDSTDISGVMFDSAQGALYGAVDGTFYAQDNLSGKITRFTSGETPVEVSDGIANSGGNDGARCQGAPRV